MILRDRDPAEHFARMLGPRVGKDHAAFVERTAGVSADPPT